MIPTSFTGGTHKFSTETENVRWEEGANFNVLLPGCPSRKLVLYSGVDTVLNNE